MGRFSNAEASQLPAQADSSAVYFSWGETMLTEFDETTGFLGALPKQKQLLFVCLSADLKVQDMNVPAKQVFGSAIKKNAAEVLSPDKIFQPLLEDAEALLAAIQQGNIEFNSTVPTPKLHIRWFINTEYETNNLLQRFFLLGFNVTSYRLIEQRLFRLENMIGHLPGNVYWMDANCIHMGCNDNVLKMLGLPREQYVGATYEQLTEIAGWQEQGASFKRDDLEVLRTGKAKANIEEAPLPHKDGTVHYYLTTRVPLFNKLGEIDGIAGISTDITELKKVEAELRTAKEKAEAATEAKSQFLANISHDFLTPLTAIIHGIDAIAIHRDDGAKLLEYCADIKTTADTLTNYVQDILEVAQFNHSGMPIRYDLFDLRKFITEIGNIFRLQAVRKGLKFKIDYPTDAIDHVVSDKHRIRRILINLLGNAVKFTAAGEIALSIETITTPQATIRLSITVADTGIGIPEDKVGIIFDKFIRLSPSYTGHYKGAGMGLNIAREFAEQLQGSLTVKSEVGKGTVFSCKVLCCLPNSRAAHSTVPHIKAEAGSPPIVPQQSGQAAPKPDLTEVKILLVEDDLMIQKFTKLVLSEFNCQITVANDGEQALRLAESTHYDLILLDLGLPDINGIAVAETIFMGKRSKSTNRPTHIVALTAHGGIKERNACSAVGIPYFCQKPLTAPEFLKICRQFNLGI